MGFPNLNTHDSEAAKQRIESAIANGATPTVRQMDTHAMKVVTQGRASFAYFLDEDLNPEPLDTTFQEDYQRRTGPLIIDTFSPHLDSHIPPRASFAEHLDDDLNPQPLGGVFEEDDKQRTGHALQ